ncbi:unnamed protein product [Trichogramma brassicae]|uniref:Uncharacterized protein n=1 Tax=Trichogramma brassicae TaxID=86971 RepID=A0A6H5IEU2_9HYME|nr:unnamed protein product [Trichogramma brassicae]
MKVFKVTRCYGIMESLTGERAFLSARSAQENDSSHCVKRDVRRKSDRKREKHFTQPPWQVVFIAYSSETLIVQTDAQVAPIHLIIAECVCTTTTTFLKTLIPQEKKKKTRPDRADQREWYVRIGVQMAPRCSELPNKETEFSSCLTDSYGEQSVHDKCCETFFNPDKLYVIRMNSKFSHVAHNSISLLCPPGWPIRCTRYKYNLVDDFPQASRDVFATLSTPVAFFGAPRISHHDLLAALSPRLADMMTHTPADTDVQQRTERFTGVLLDCYNNVAPLRNYSVSARSRPWVSAEIRDLIKQRDRAYRHACRTEELTDIAAYRRLRSQIKVLLDNEKRD